MEPWIIYAFLAAVSAAAVGVFSKIGISGIDPTLATAVRGLSIALFMGLASIILGKLSSMSSVPTKTWVFIILTGVAGGLSWLWGFMALKAGGDATAVNAIDRLSLIMLVFLAIFFLGESFTWAKFSGAILIIGGTLLMTLKPEKLAALFVVVRNIF